MTVGGHPAPTPSMLTVNVCAEISAIPSTAGPVLNSVARPPTDSATTLCAGHHRSGTHRTVSSVIHSNLPVIGGADCTVNRRSVAGRLVTGALNVTNTGCATPTTSPRAGSTDAMGSPVGGFTAAALDPACTVTTVAAIPIAATTDRTAARITTNRLCDG